MLSQIKKDIFHRNQQLANPYWHFEHDPTVASEMKPLLDMSEEAGMPWSFGSSNPFK